MPLERRVTVLFAINPSNRILQTKLNAGNVPRPRREEVKTEFLEKWRTSYRKKSADAFIWSLSSFEQAIVHSYESGTYVWSSSVCSGYVPQYRRER